MNYFLFALRNLRRKGIRSWLTLLGICIGIAAVISLIGLGNGLKDAVVSQFGVTSTEVITVKAGGLNYGAPGSDVPNPLTLEDVAEINRLGTVEYAVGRAIETIMIEYNDKIIFSYAVSIKEGYEKESYDVLDDIEIEYGRFLKTGDSGKIIIGNSLYDESKNGFDKSIIPGKNILINGVQFEVVGVIKKKGSFLSDSLIYIYDNDLNDLANYGDDVDIIDVKVRNKGLMNKTKTDIEKLMRKRRDVKAGHEDFTVSTPESSLEQVNQILGAIQIFVAIIASISIVIGAIGIVNTMTTSVLERRKEIGIMKAVGAKNSQIFSQFFIESGFLGLIGGGLGVLFGVLLGFFGTFAINNFLGSTSQPQLNFYLIFFSLFGSFLIGALAGIFPAMRAATQNPVQALTT